MADYDRPLPSGGPTAGGDEFDDDLFNYDVDDNDPFGDNYVPEAAKERAKAEKEKASKAALDEEVKIARKPRAPRVKLDENRLLSQNGIPKLRAKAKHLKFDHKAKGQEYKQIQNLLQVYQLWLDDLFPKARFLDALAMVERMGHKKRMQMARMEWINEGKPKQDNDDPFEEPTLPPRDNEREKTVPIAPIFEKRASERPRTPPNADDDMDDIYDATPKATRKQPVTKIDSLFGSASLSGNAQTVVEDVPMEDDLDALLAEEEELLQAMGGDAPSAPAASKVAVEAGIDDDEEAAMAEMDFW